MRSRQINFFISNNELSKFNKYIESNQWLIIDSRSPDGQPVILPIIERSESSNSYTVYLVKKEDLPTIKFRYIEKLNVYSLDFLTGANAIEFMRPYYDAEKNFTRRGRLFYELNYVNEQKEPTLKSAEFLKAADKLFNAFRRTFKNVKSDKFKGFIITANTHKLIAEEKLELKQV